MLTEYKGEFQHCFRSKCCGYIFLNLPPKKNLEVIPFILNFQNSVNRTRSKLAEWMEFCFPLHILQMPMYLNIAMQRII